MNGADNNNSGYGFWEEAKIADNAVTDRFPKHVGELKGLDVTYEKFSSTLPTDSKERKNYPLHAGCVRYFPAALAGVAKISKEGNDKHNPGQELFHARGKSMDHADCLIRHLIDLDGLLAAGASAEEVLREASSLAWRALALSQELHETLGAPLAPGAVEEYQYKKSEIDDATNER